MNLPKMIAELQAERDRLDEAILALERLSTSPVKRRGRPSHSTRAEDEETGHDVEHGLTAELIDGSSGDGISA